jgi:hypothetical protein
MKRLIFKAVALSLILVFSQTFSAQTTNDSAKKSLKALKKSLAKNSRYGNEIIYWFSPISFKGCEVSYRFARLNENPSEKFATVVADKTSPLVRTNTVRDEDLTLKPSTTQQTTGQNVAANNQLSTQTRARAKVFYNNSFPYYYYGIDQRTFSLEQFVTWIDLSSIDASSIKFETTNAGQNYIVFKSLKDKTAIAKRLPGGEEDFLEVDSDFVPLADKKSGAKVSAAFIEAVNACQ